MDMLGEEAVVEGAIRLCGSLLRFGRPQDRSARARAACEAAARIQLMAKSEALVELIETYLILMPRVDEVKARRSRRFSKTEDGAEERLDSHPRQA